MRLALRRTDREFMAASTAMEGAERASCQAPEVWFRSGSAANKVRRCPYRPPAPSHAAISARSSPVISVTLPGGIALDHAALRPIRRALRRI